MRGARVLVTGGAGFIGAELAHQLVGAGAAVTVVDNLVNGKREHLAGLAPEVLRFVEADVRDGARMAELLAGTDVVFHLACLGVRHSIHSPAENHDVNATATLQLLALARAAGVERFVHVSSSEVYGTARWAPMTEAHPTYPLTVYGAGKLAGECYARAYHETYGFPTVVVRPFNAYGPRSHHEGDSGEVIPRFLLRALAGRPLIVFGDGTQTRDFTYVADTARGILLAATAAAAVGQTINLGSGREIAINELARTVLEVAAGGAGDVQHDVPRPGDVLRLYADSTLAGELLGFAPAVPLREGLERLAVWYGEQGEPPEALLAQEVLHNWQSVAAAAPAPARA
ncbi:MAG: NAD-dependent epimerase/dehydratase family protein [Dehalococcoidia bacterium]|nr:NAD-dependent epimerase/dehydratase family protein [Dehalococcoidia bacterium]